MNEDEKENKRSVDNTGGCCFNTDVLDYLKTTFSETQLRNIQSNLSLPPRWTTVRVNSLHCTVPDVISRLNELIGDRYSVSEHSRLPDVVTIAGNKSDLSDRSSTGRVVIDQKCGKAVLRGADVYSPGVKGLPHLQTGAEVSVHVDLARRCKRGEKKYAGETVHIADGVLQMTRFDIFKRHITSGVAVQITKRKIDSPSLNGVLDNLIFLQNLPSVVTSHVLDPQPGDHVLDMCSAPGGKTTHIAQLMQDTGCVVALEKVQNKCEKLRLNIAKQNLNCITVFKCDSTKAFDGESTSSFQPPFGREVFDRILLDPPCSAMGQRPQLISSLTFSEVSSYPSYQWCFVADAIKMLKPGGVLVYSTCTLPKQENELVVARVLQTFPEMKLVPAEPRLGRPGVLGVGLSEEQAGMVQRFIPDDCDSTHASADSDTIGFFIAKFFKCH